MLILYGFKIFLFTLASIIFPKKLIYFLLLKPAQLVYLTDTLSQTKLDCQIHMKSLN